MEQTMLSKKEGPLLTYAVSKLNPDVFSHPVWVRFSKKDEEISAGVIDNLAALALKLQDENPNDACQLLLICAVHQNYAGQANNALMTLQQILTLAKRNGLTQELLWANWGACAICLQHDLYEQAIGYLDELQIALSAQNEWILADFVDMIKRFLRHSVTFCTESSSEISSDQPFNDLVHDTFLWLQQWGFSTQFSEAEISANPPGVSSARADLSPSLFSVQRWQGHWHTLMEIFKGNLGLHWVKNEAHPAKRELFFQHSTPNSQHSCRSDRKADTEVINDVSQIPSVPVLLPPKGSSPPRVKTRNSTRSSKVDKVQRNWQPGQATIAIPVAVYMLGTFSLTIRDLRVKLPASRSLSLLKFLLLHHKQNTPREVLMDVFWPEADPEMARNDLNVAMHNLRKAIRAVIFLPVIVFEDGAYGLEPNLQVWLDVEEFERCAKAGQGLEAREQLSASLTEYETAISLYQGDFLEQSPYEEWTILDRERLRVMYLNTLDRLSQIYFRQRRYAACITVCQLLLTRDRCREDTNCLLMRCYSRQGQYHLALRQYQTCVEALGAELDIIPARETTDLYERIRRRERV